MEILYERLEINRLQKVLEGANIKLSSVASDILGASARAMLEAIIHGTDDPHLLSQLAKGRMKKKKKELERALRGLVGPHQKLLLSTQLQHIDFLDQQIAILSQEIANRLRPFEEALELLETIPGIGRCSAESVLAEIGTNMNRFPSAAHLASWAGIAPGNNESAGKRKSGKTRKGNKYLRATLVEAARAAARTKNTYLSAQYHRIAARRGSSRAAVAVAHSIIVIIYHILKKRQPYIDLGADYFDRLKKDAVVKKAVKKLESLGYKVNLEEIVA